MRPDIRRWEFWLVLGLLLSAQVGLGQSTFPKPNLLAIYPAGGQAGQTIVVNVTEQFQLEYAQGLQFSHPGIKASPVRLEANAFYPEPRSTPNTFEVRIDPDTPPGVYEVRAESRYGLTNARRFVVGDLPERMESEENNSRDTANRIAVGETINGLFGADYDFFRFKAQRGQKLIISCRAWRLDSRGDAVLTVYDSNGRQLHRMHDAAGTDPVIDFTPPADGEYYACVNDLTYTAGGGRNTAPYRLTIDTRPWIDFVEPPFLASEGVTRIRVFGRNLGGTITERTFAGRPLEMIELEVEPSKLKAVDPLQSRCHPTEAALEYRALQIDTAEGPSNPVLLAIVNGPLIQEAEPNEKIEEGQVASLPAVFAGRFDKPGDVDGYRFRAKKGEKLWIEVHSQRLRQPTDVSFVVQQLSQNQEGEWTARDRTTASDLPSPAGNFRIPLASDDPAVLFEVPEDGDYRVLIRDDFGGVSEGPYLAYQLTIRPPRPDFHALTLAGQELSANTNNNRALKPATCSLIRGGSAEIVVAAYRLEGFDGELTVSLANSPAGVHCEPIKITGDQTMAGLLLRADNEAKQWSGPIQVVVEGVIDGKALRRDAKNVELLWDSPRDNRSSTECRLSPPIVLSIHEGLEVLGSLTPSATSFQTSRGGKLEIPVTFAKSSDLAPASLSVSAINPPNRVTGSAATVAADKEAKVTLDVLQDVKPGRYTLYFRGEADMDFEREKPLLDQAVADQKRIQEALQEAGKDFQKRQAEKRTADQKAQQAATQLAQGKSALQTAAQNETRAKQALENARKQAGAEGAGEAAKAALTAAETQHGQAATALETAKKMLAEAEKIQGDALKAQQAAAEAETAAKTHNDLATQAKREIDQTLNQLRTVARKAKIKMPVHSPLVSVEILPMPFRYVDLAERVEIKPEGSLEIAFKIERLFAFADAADVQLQSPVGSKLRFEANGKIPAKESQAALKLLADKSLEPGEYDCEWIVRTRYNNRPLEERIPFQVRVVP